MGHYETVCLKCYSVLSNMSYDNKDEIVAQCKETGCPHKSPIEKFVDRVFEEAVNNPILSIEDQYYIGLMICKERYLEMLYEPMGLDPNDHRTRIVTAPLKLVELYRFIQSDFHLGIVDRLPLNKLNRWLGYIQGCLIWEGLTTVEAERDFTRPLFRPIDFKED